MRGGTTPQPRLAQPGVHGKDTRRDMTQSNQGGARYA